MDASRSGQSVVVTRVMRSNMHAGLAPGFARTVSLKLRRPWKGLGDYSVCLSQLRRNLYDMSALSHSGLDDHIQATGEDETASIEAIQEA